MIILNDYVEAKYYGGWPRGKSGGTVDPRKWEGVLIHSAAKLPNVVDYITKNPDRKVSYHFAQNKNRTSFIQCVPLNKRAWHGGKFFNDKFISVCWSGPNDIDRSLTCDYMDDIQYLSNMIFLLDACCGKSLKLALHRHVNVKKRDPGGIRNLLYFLDLMGCYDAHYTKNGLIWKRRALI